MSENLPEKLPMLLTLDLREVPAALTESAGYVLKSHGFAVVGPDGQTITDQRLDELLRELGKNGAQMLVYGAIDPDEEG